MKRNLIFPAALLLTAALSAETINFSADYMKGTAGSKTDSTTLEGNAFVKTDTMEIKADSIELSGDDFRFITAQGNVKGSNSESKLEFDCGRMKYDRKTKIASLEDSVHLVDTANNVSADAQIIEYNQDSETAIMQIAITLKQKDNTSLCDLFMSDHADAHQNSRKLCEQVSVKQRIFDIDTIIFHK